MTYMYSGLVVWRQAAASFWSVCAALPRKRLSAARHNTNSVHDLHLKCLRRRSIWVNSACAAHSGQVSVTGLFIGSPVRGVGWL
jgi:hypothetical protein